MPKCKECQQHFLEDDLKSRGVFCSNICQELWQTRNEMNELKESVFALVKDAYMEGAKMTDKQFKFRDAHWNFSEAKQELDRLGFYHEDWQERH